MSLMASTWAPAAFSSLRQLDVVVEVYLRLVRVAQVAGVADRRLAQLAGLEHRLDGDAHVRDPVERVEDAEQVDAAPRRRCATKKPHDVVRIVGVADGVGRAQQHLQQQVRHRARAARASRSQGSSCRKRMATSKVAPPHTPPRTAAAAGARSTGAIAAMSRVRMRVASSDWCASRMRRVGEQHALLLAASTARSAPARARRASACVPGGGRAAAAPAAAAAAPSCGGRARPVDLGVAVDDDLADVS